MVFYDEKKICWGKKFHHALNVNSSICLQFFLQKVIYVYNAISRSSQLYSTTIWTRKVCQYAIRDSVLVHVLFSRIKKQGSDTSLKKALVPRDMWRAG